jgi:hypothetical protein
VPHRITRWWCKVVALTALPKHLGCDVLASSPFFRAPQPDLNMRCHIGWWVAEEWVCDTPAVARIHVLVTFCWPNVVVLVVALTALPKHLGCDVLALSPFFHARRLHALAGGWRRSGSVTPMLLLVVDIVVLNFGERSSCGSTAYVGVDRSFPTLACPIHPLLVSLTRPSYFGVAASFNGALPPLAHRFLNGLICAPSRPRMSTPPSTFLFLGCSKRVAHRS